MDLEEVEVRTHLYWSVSRIAYGERDAASFGIIFQIILTKDNASNRDALVGCESLVVGV